MKNKSTVCQKLLDLIEIKLQVGEILLQNKQVWSDAHEQCNLIVIQSLTFHAVLTCAQAKTIQRPYTVFQALHRDHY